MKEQAMPKHRKTMDEIPPEVWDSVRAKWVKARDRLSFEGVWGYGCALCDYLEEHCGQNPGNCDLCPMWADHWCREYTIDSRIAPKYHDGDVNAWSKDVTKFIEFITPYCTKAAMSAEENDR